MLLLLVVDSITFLKGLSKNVFSLVNRVRYLLLNNQSQILSCFVHISSLISSLGYNIFLLLLTAASYQHPRAFLPTVRLEMMEASLCNIPGTKMCLCSMRGVDLHRFHKHCQ